MHSVPPMLGMDLKRMTSAQRWTIIGAIIGVVVGFSTVIFYYSLQFATSFFMGDVVGYAQPLPLGEGGTPTYTFSISHYMLLPLVIIIGALVSGIIVYKFAPETAGHGTDAVIRAFHNEDGAVRLRASVVKLVSASLLIGSGGSGGREGPTAQFAAGIGHAISKRLNISKSDKRTITAIALGAGIGAIFRAPFGGALLAGEILYKHDMEVEAIAPAVIASIIGFAIFGAFVGYTPIFGTGSGVNGFTFSAYNLLFFALVGVFTGLFARLYIKVFYHVHGFFSGLRVHNAFKPAIGAVVTGMVALAFPEVVGVGYGWIQLIITSGFQSFVGTYGMPLALFFVILALAKMLVTSTSIGSGGSGGVFAPGMFIGCSVGASIALTLGALFPASVPPYMVGAMAVIGMLSFFGAAGKVSIAVTIMVVEMTGSLALLPAGMIAIALARLVSGEDSIYRSQVNTRRDSPAHIGEFYTPLMRRVKVRDVMRRGEIAIRPGTPIYRAEYVIRANSLASAPVVTSSGRLIGAAYIEDMVALGEAAKRAEVSSVARRVRHVDINDATSKAWAAMVKNRASWCAVLDGGRFVGVVRMRSIFRKYSGSD